MLFDVHWDQRPGGKWQPWVKNDLRHGYRQYFLVEFH